MSRSGCDPLLLIPSFVIAMAGLGLFAASTGAFGEQIVGMVVGWCLVAAASLSVVAIL